MARSDRAQMGSMIREEVRGALATVPTSQRLRSLAIWQQLHRREGRGGRGGVPVSNG